MKFMKFPLLCLLIILTFSGVADAQLCGPDYSSLEFYQIGDGERAKPGDTIYIPVKLTNSKGVQSLQLYFEYDKTVLTPLFYFLDSSRIITVVDSIPDTTYILFDNYQIVYAGGRMNVTQDNNGGDFLSASDEFENISPDAGKPSTASALCIGCHLLSGVRCHTDVKSSPPIIKDCS